MVQMVSLRRVYRKEKIMKLLPANAADWGFTHDDISHLETISKERADYLSKHDAKGKLLSGVVKEYSHLKSGSCDFTSPAVKIGN